MKNYKKIILDNGIPLYLYNDKSLRKVYFNYIVKYGSNGKWFDFNLNGKNIHVLPGCAHYLEHLLCETSKYGNIGNLFEKKLSFTNAVTSKDYTSYYFYGLNDIKESMKQMIEMIEEPIFDDNTVNKSRHAIEEEAAEDCDDENYKAIALIANNLYKDFNIYDESLCEIGNRTTTKNITTEDLYNCYNAFYTNDRKLLVIAGNLNEEELTDYLNNVFSKLKEHNDVLILPKYNSNDINKSEEIMQGESDDDIYGFGIKLNKQENISMKDLTLATKILQSHLYSDKNNLIIKLEQKELIDNISYCINMNEDNDILLLQSFQSKKSKKYLDVINREIDKLKITRKEYELIIKSFIADEIRKTEDKYYMPSEFADRMYMTEDYSDIEYLKNIKYDDIMNILNNLDYSNQTKCKIKSLTNK